MTKKIAIIGSGISGLTAAYLLHSDNNIVVYEANDYIGGHTSTKTITIDEQVLNVDTGFIVFNDWTYPNFIKLLNKLGVDSEPTEMGFSVKCEQSGLEYSGTNLNTLFAQRRNLFKPYFWQLIRDIVRFNKESVAALDDLQLNPSMTLGEYLKQNNYSEAFINYYLIPMGSAIWSTSLNDMMHFPVLFFVRFFKNHGLLSINERPQWRVIKSGSKSYIEKMLPLIGESIRVSTPVNKVARKKINCTYHIEITSSDGIETFDHVIFACHSDQALDLLSDPSDEEQRILSALPYRNNEVVLHTDDSLLPNKKMAWSSWNYHLTGSSDNPAAVTYDMNILQNLDCRKTICVTLNNTNAIDPNKIIETYQYSHPVFTQDGIQAQKEWESINHIKNTSFCGAYWLNGFHEDGVNSALRVVEKFGVKL